MARITVEDCIDKFKSRFELVLVASNRARKLHSGETPTVDKDNDKNTVIALREIAEETLSIDDMKNSLVEEFQTVSPIDEEELSLEDSDSDSTDNQPINELVNNEDASIEVQQELEENTLNEDASIEVQQELEENTLIEEFKENKEDQDLDNISS